MLADFAASSMSSLKAARRGAGSRGVQNTYWTSWFCAAKRKSWRVEVTRVMASRKTSYSSITKKGDPSSEPMASMSIVSVNDRSPPDSALRSVTAAFWPPPSFFYTHHRTIINISYILPTVMFFRPMHCSVPTKPFLSHHKKTLQNQSIPTILHPTSETSH